MLPVLEPEEESALDITLTAHDHRKSDLIAILIEISEQIGYLPRAVLINLSHRLGIALSDVFRVATFYATFSLVPVGRHIVEVCSGTSCHVRGANSILDRLRTELQLDVGQTSEDMRFTLRTVNCLGCCALAPALRIGAETYGFVKTSEVAPILRDHP